MECSIPLAMRQEVSRCLLCYDAPCSKACPAKNKPDRFLRALYFQNSLGAARITVAENPLAEKCAASCQGNAYCQKACIRRKIDKPIDIPSIQSYLAQLARKIDINPYEKSVVTHHPSISIIGHSISVAALAIFLSRKGGVQVYCTDTASWMATKEGKNILQANDVAIQCIQSIQDETIWRRDADICIITSPIEMGFNNKQVYIACELEDDDALDVVSVRKGRECAQKVWQYIKEREEEKHEECRYVH